MDPDGDINDFVPSLSNPRCFRRDGLSLTQVSTRSHLSLSLKKPNISKVKRNKTKPKPLADNNSGYSPTQSSQLLTASPNRCFESAFDKENVFHNESVIYTTPRKGKSKIIKQSCFNIDVANSGEDYTLKIAKSMAEKRASLNFKLNINRSITLETDSNTVIKRLNVTSKDNIMQFDCVLENNVIVLSDSEFEAVPETVAAKSTKENNVAVTPSLRSTPIKNRASTSRGIRKKSRKALLDTSIDSSHSSLKQSSIVRFLSPPASNIDLNISAASNGVRYTAKSATPEVQTPRSPTMSFLNNNDILSDNLPEDLPRNGSPSLLRLAEPNEVLHLSATSIVPAQQSTPLKSKRVATPQQSTPWMPKRVSKTQKVPGSPRATRPKKNVPSFKIVEGTPFAVDAFSYGDLPGVEVYFLTHFHSDHYVGLRKSFKKPLCCSTITAELCKMKLGINEKIITILDVDQSISLNGIEITAVDANHCPGSVMLIFSLPNGENILHCGDFRANDLMESYPILWTKDIQTIYLDTTYCQKRYNFPTQEESIAEAINVLRNKKEQMDKCGLDFRRVLIACGTYYIGKEKFFMSLADELGCNIWTSQEKSKVLEIIEGRPFTSKPPEECQLHVLSLGDLAITKLANLLNSVSTAFDEVIAFRPTGWQNTTTCNRKGNITIWGIPYSEHSSYTELKRFITYLRPNTVIPTVPIGKINLQKHIQSWLTEKQTVQTRVSDYFRSSAKS